MKASQATELESNLTRLREENASLNKKVSELSSMEAARKKADAKVSQLEEKMDEMILERVAQKENELHATYDEKLRNSEDRYAAPFSLHVQHDAQTLIHWIREKDLVRQLSLAQTQLRDLRMSNETNQAKLLDHSQRQGDCSCFHN